VTGAPSLHPRVLDLDCEAEARRIAAWMRDSVSLMHRRGVVVALSGGVDSSVCAALSVRAFGAARVYGLLMPEHDSSRTSAQLGESVARHLGIAFSTEHIGMTLDVIGCYRRRDEAIRALFPDYTDGWKSKIVIAGGGASRLTFFRLVVQAPDGTIHERRLPLREYLQIVAATSFKQRIRKTIEYYHGDRLNYAVVGTPNLLEYDQGFFVKNGDGAADLKPIAHLYKTQVYAMARHLGLPEDVCSAIPTTDTYSLPQGQDEFYFTLPYAQMDLALWAHDAGISAGELGEALGVTGERAAEVYADIEAKRRAAGYLHAQAMRIGSRDDSSD
jgi:NAD+ synthase